MRQAGHRGRVAKRRLRIYTTNADPTRAAAGGSRQAGLHGAAAERVVGHRPDLRADMAGGRVCVFHRRRVLPHDRRLAGRVAHAHRHGPRRDRDGTPGRRGTQLEGLRCHSDAGSQFTSIRYGERLAELGAVPSIGTVGDSYDNALAETVNGLYKSELIRGPGQGPWKTVADVELATLGWVHWHNTERLHGYLGDVPPAEFETASLRCAQPTPTSGLESNSPSLHQTQGDSVLPAPAGTSRTPPARTTPHGCAFQESSGTALDRFLAGRCLRRPRFSLHQIARSGTLLRVAGSVFTCGLCDDWAMKLSTAVARLTDVVDGLDRAVRWPETSLSAAFVFGAALDGAADLDRVDVARSWSPRHPRLCRGCHDPRTSKRWPPGCGLRTCLCRGSGARRSGRSGTTRSNTGADLDRRRWQGPVRP